MTDEPRADRYRRAMTFFEAQQFSQAAPMFAQLVTEEPDRLDLHMLLARSWYGAASLGRVETELRAIVQKWPDEAYAHLMLGRTLQRLTRHEEADRQLRIAEALGASE